MDAGERVGEKIFPDFTMCIFDPEHSVVYDYIQDLLAPAKGHTKGKKTKKYPRPVAEFSKRPQFPHPLMKLHSRRRHLGFRRREAV